MARKYGQLKAAYMECRTLGHMWVEGSMQWAPKITYLNGTRLVFICERCEMGRYEVWSYATGELMSRGYVQPKGYSLPTTDLPGDMTLRQAMRIEYLSRQKRSRSAS